MKYKMKARIDRYAGNTILFALLLGAMLGLVIILTGVLVRLR